MISGKCCNPYFGLVDFDSASGQPGSTVGHRVALTVINHLLHQFLKNHQAYEKRMAAEDGLEEDEMDV